MKLDRRSAALAAACSAGILAVWTSTASAQASPDAASAVAVPPMTCEKPGTNPPNGSSPDATRFQKRVDEYKACVQAYTKSTGAKANEFAAQARAYNDAANNAINDYNTYVTQLNESVKNNR